MAKPQIIVLLFVVICSWAYGSNFSHNASEVEWVDDYDLALLTARKEGKPVFIYFGSPS